MAWTTRLDFHARLVGLLGSNNVYFQPPESYKLQYPCIVYERSSNSVVHADDAPYLIRPVYQVTAIYRDPDSPLPQVLSEQPGSSFDRKFTSDNLYHAVFTFTIS